MAVNSEETSLKRENRSIAMGFVVIFIALLGCIVATPVQLPVDGHEYLCTAASLIYTHNMLVEREDIVRAAELVSPETFFVAPRSGNYTEYGQNAKLNKKGQWLWGSHSYYLALAAIPFVVLFGAKGFIVLNAVCVMAMLFFLYKHLREMNSAWTSFVISCACILCSGTITYVFWINSEVMIMALMSGALYFGFRRHPLLGVALLGAAVALKPPLIFLFIPLALWNRRHACDSRAPLTMAIVLVLVGLPQLYFYYHNYSSFSSINVNPPPLTEQEKNADAYMKGILDAASVKALETTSTASNGATNDSAKAQPGANSSAKPKADERRMKVPGQDLFLNASAAARISSSFGATLKYNFLKLYYLFDLASPIRFWAYWFAPGTGMIWFYPAILWCLLRNRWPRWTLAAFLASILAICLTSMVPVNFYSTEAGIRYATLVAPIFFFLAGSWKGSALDWAAVAPIAFFGGALAMDAAQGPRNFEQINACTFPSMALPREFGFTIYPEVIYESGSRWDRDVAFDYIDNQGYIRNNHVQLAARNVSKGDMIIKMLPDSGYGTGEIDVSTPSGATFKTPLEGGKIATALIPILADYITNVPFPEYRFTGQQDVPATILRLETPGMKVKIGDGELRWQYRRHSVTKFLYRAGPRILTVYPSRDWILNALASELIQPEDAATLAQSFASTTAGVRMFVDSSDWLEGSHSTGVRNSDKSAPKAEIIASGKRELPEIARMYERVEVSGWEKSDAFERASDPNKAPSARVMIYWYDKEGFYLDQSVAWETSGGEETWTPRKEVVSIPRLARSMTFGVTFDNAVGVVKFDDLIVSIYKDLWEKRH
jgi:hypothetical protein